MQFEQLCAKYATDKGKYANVYPLLLESLRNQVTSILEMGLGGGGSLRVWMEYLPNARIYGLDIQASVLRDIPITEEEHRRIQVVIGDQSDAVFMLSVLHMEKAFDIVIDDAGHEAVNQKIAFDILFPHVRGLYFVEDIPPGTESLEKHWGVSKLPQHVWIMSPQSKEYVAVFKGTGQ